MIYYNCPLQADLFFYINLISKTLTIHWTVSEEKQPSLFFSHSQKYSDIYRQFCISDDFIVL